MLDVRVGTVTETMGLEETLRKLKPVSAAMGIVFMEAAPVIHSFIYPFSLLVGPLQRAGQCSAARTGETSGVTPMMSLSMLRRNCLSIPGDK